MSTKEKQELFLNRINSIHGDSIEITTDFLGTAHPITYRCAVCGNVNEVKRAMVLVSKNAINRKHSCRKCFWEYTHKKHREEAREKALEKIKKHPTILILKEYRDDIENRLYFELACNTCNHEWEINATSNLRSKWKGCPDCWKNNEEFKKATEEGRVNSRKKRSNLSKERFFETLKERMDIVLLEPYHDAGRQLTFQCTKCHNQWKTSPSHIMNSKSGCPMCNSGQTKAKEDYEKDVKRKHGDTIQVLEAYQNASTKILHKCKTCKNEWKATPNTIKKGIGCPTCKASKGEKRITNYLKENDIHFIPEWKEHACKHYKKLPFDFYLPHYNLVIEFQGIQHEKFSPPLHKTPEDLKKQQKRDGIKREYCRMNQIGFLEIWYYEFDHIENILGKTLENVRLNIHT